MTVRGMEAINLFLATKNPTRIDKNIEIVRGREVMMHSNDADKKPALTSAERYSNEWSQLLKDLRQNPECMKDLAFNGDLKISKFRSIYWALLLRVLNVDSSTWYIQREQQRLRYGKLEQEFVKNPHENNVDDSDNPLSQSTQSVWNQYFSDQELCAVIKQDVVRTFPGVDFFRKTNIQNAMINILFYYAREHPYMCYRQGMHEVLAPILFVVFADHQALLHFKEVAKTEIDCTLLNVLNPDFLEADTYSIFSRLMSSIESYYRVSNALHSPHAQFSPKKENLFGTFTETEVIGQLNSIRDKILAKEDIHLHNYLLKLDIPLHIFGIRWLRLLFGREFPLLDLLVLWDAIFADSDRFDLPNYILVAMLIHIRGKLLLSDYTTCLTYLMRYPNNVDIHLILKHALHMQVPKRFDCPPNAFVYCTLEGQTKTAHIPSNILSPPSSSQLNNVNAVNELTSSTNRTRSSSLSENAKMERLIQLQQARNAAEAAMQARLHVEDNLERTMDGYSDNSPELMRLELKNAQTVMKIAHNKLRAYLGTIHRHVANHKSEELSQALSGIEDLCYLLDVRSMFPPQIRQNAPIDEALEANDQTAKDKVFSQVSKNNAKKSDYNYSEEKKILLSQNSPSSSTSTTTYERPDNDFMHNSSRLLGQLREIELLTISSSDERIDFKNQNMKDETNHKNKKDGLPIVDPIGQRRE